MEDIVKKYWELVLKDKKYLEEYIFNKKTGNQLYDSLKRQMEEYFLWRKINSYEEMENIIHSGNAIKLLRFNDYYSDEISEVLEEHLKINFQKLDVEEIENMLSDNNLQKIVEDSTTPKQLKDCIMIERESRAICEELNMYLYLIENSKTVEKQIKS